MFNSAFYPTPKPVIEQVIASLPQETRKTLYRLQILEPSAGKGDIADYLAKYHEVAKDKIHCIEIEPDLQAILREKGYKVIDSDFLNFKDPYSFDLILMNPPFDKGVDHILHA